MPAIRKKVCSPCREARTRCSLDIPKCKRCLSRKLKCGYTETRQGEEQAPWRIAADLPTFFTDPAPDFLESRTGTDVETMGSSDVRNNNSRDDDGDFVLQADWDQGFIVSDNTRAMFQSSGEISTDTTILPYESHNATRTNDFCISLSTEFGFNLQELMTNQSPNNTEAFDQIFPMCGRLSPMNSSTTDFPLTYAGARHNLPRRRPLLLTQKKAATIGQTLSSNHVRCGFRVGSENVY
jgi:hypothetical protein